MVMLHLSEITSSYLQHIYFNWSQVIAFNLSHLAKWVQQLCIYETLNVEKVLFANITVINATLSGFCLYI